MTPLGWLGRKTSTQTKPQGQVCFPMHLYEPHTFEWESCWEFLLKPLSQICSNFTLSLLRLGERKIAKMVAVHWPRWPPYMVKPFKNLLLQNRRCLGAESVHKSSGTGDLPKLLKRLSYVDIWPFYSKVKFASLCIAMAAILKIYFSLLLLNWKANWLQTW